MYAVVVIGSRMRRSACGTNLRTFCPWANATGMLKTAPRAKAPITAAIERRSAERLLIAKVSLNKGAQYGSATTQYGSATKDEKGLCLTDGRESFALRDGHQVG